LFTDVQHGRSTNDDGNRGEGPAHLQLVKQLPPAVAVLLINLKVQKNESGLEALNHGQFLKLII
jgi:hypothetical protein